MTAVVTSRTRLAGSRAPRWPFAVNPSHPLALDLRGAFIWRNGRMYEMVSGKFLTKVNTGNTLTEVYDPITNQLMTEFSGTSTTRDRWSFGSVTQNDPLSLSDTGVATIVCDVRFDSVGGGGFPRIIDKSSGGNALNGWAFYVELDRLVPDDAQRIQVDVTASAPVNDLVEADGAALDEVWGVTFRTSVGGARKQYFWRDGIQVGEDATNPVNTIPTTTANLSIGHWNHADTNRQWDGLIRRVFVWGRDVLDSEMARATTRIGAWDMFEEYGRNLYSFPVATTITKVPGADSLALLGHSATVQETGSVVKGPNKASLTLTGASPSLELALRFLTQPGLDALALTGDVPTTNLIQRFTTLPGAGAVTITGKLAVRAVAQAVAPGAGALQLGDLADATLTGVGFTELSENAFTGAELSIVLAAGREFIGLPDFNDYRQQVIDGLTGTLGEIDATKSSLTVGAVTRLSATELRISLTQLNGVYDITLAAEEVWTHNGIPPDMTVEV